MKNRLVYAFCLYFLLCTVACKYDNKSLAIKKINIETLDLKEVDVNQLYEKIGYKRSDLVPHDSLGYYMIERGVYYKLPFDFFDAQKDNKNNDSNPFKGFISYEVLDWLDSDVSVQEEIDREKSGNDKAQKIKQVAYFANLGFEYINFIADAKGKVNAVVLRTRQNKTNKKYFDEVMHTMERKLGKPFRMIRDTAYNSVTWPIEVNIWLINDRMYQFSTLINPNQREGIQLLVVDKTLVKKFDSNKNPKFTVYLNYDSLDLAPKLIDSNQVVKSLAKP